MRSFFLAMMLVLPLALWSQDFSGRWAGYCMDSVSGHQQKLSLNICSPGLLLTGVIHWYYPNTQHFSDYAVNGQFHLQNEKIWLFENNNPSTINLPIGGRADGYYLLEYKLKQGIEILEGYWYRMNYQGKEGNKRIRLERKTGKFIPLPPFTHTHHSDTTQSNKARWAVNDRVSPVMARIPVTDDSVKIRLFDNGEIDGDSVALYFNNQLILQHLKLKTEAKVLYLAIDKTIPVNRLLLVAENLGTMPPNTALMEITSHEKIYNIFLSTDFQKNAMVEFILKRD